MTYESERVTRKKRIDPQLKASGWSITQYQAGMDLSRIEYHGTLWLLQEMVLGEILIPRDAAVALRSMLDNKRWLPRSEMRKIDQKMGI